ncbi:MAG TPA: radical SAM protein [Lentimicrobium sp.]|nr:radical SAM protein [Lentimicrobium sp.]
MVFLIKKKLGKLPVVDLTFPTSINLEISSLCNLSCMHCPSHLPLFKNMVKSHGLMKMEVFNKAMDEIDSHGTTRLALHKDGEPLLHPQIMTILNRVKKNQPHIVTLITNAHLLTDEICDAILKGRIDNIIFSIGASGEDFYKKIKGDGFDLVINNILRFLEKRENFNPAPTVTVQIVNLPEYPEMKAEIRQFKQFWKRKPVRVKVFDKLNWGIFDSEEEQLKRYPCPSLWRDLFVHWDAKVSACCIDWDQSIIVGDLKQQTMAEIWKGDKIRSYRSAHLKNQFSDIPLCEKCNFWSKISRLE